MAFTMPIKLTKMKFFIFLKKTLHFIFKIKRSEPAINKIQAKTLDINQFTNQINTWKKSNSELSIDSWVFGYGKIYNLTYSDSNQTFWITSPIFKGHSKNCIKYSLRQIKRFELIDTNTIKVLYPNGKTDLFIKH